MKIGRTPTELISYLYNTPGISFKALMDCLPDRRLTQPFELVTVSEIVNGAINEETFETVYFNQG